MLADGSSFLFEANRTPYLIKNLFKEFRKTVKDPSYWDSNKFILFLRSKGVKAETIFISEFNTIYSWKESP